MNLNEFVGLPVELVVSQLEKLNIKCKVVESSDIQKTYDTILVVRATQKDGFVMLVTDKFLLKI